MNFLRGALEGFRGLSPRDQGMIAYGAVTVGYGVARKAAEMRGATLSVTAYDADFKRTDRTVPVLLVDTAFVCAVGGLTAVYLWPLYAVLDARKLEVALRVADPSDYGHDSGARRSILDYLLD